MAGSYSTDLHNKLIDHIMKTTPYVVPTNIYVALVSVVGDESGAGTELSGNGYARIVHNSWDVAASGASENTGVITFAAASGGDWLEAVAFELFDAITGGNYLGYGDLTISRTVLSGDNAEFADGELDVSITP